jgi:hypothetical protein
MGSPGELTILPRRSIPMWAVTLEASRCAPVVLELNPLYAAGYNVPTAHAPLVPALGADLARRAGDAGSTSAEILESASVLACEPVEHSLAMRLFDRQP